MTTGRGQALGFSGAVSSPHTLTSTTAMAVLAAGGNAVDAAIAANATQGTVAPETCGIGGDLFALVWEPGTESPTALNASGPAGSGVSASGHREAGHATIPNDHPSSVSIPGVVAGWQALVDRYGSTALRDLMAPAVDFAMNGFPASHEFSRSTKARFDQLSAQPSGAELFPGGQPAEVGERITRPRLATTLKAIGSDGASAFYTGQVASNISTATQGQVTTDDLARYQPQWVTPLSKRVFGQTGWTIGPNTQGYLTLAALRVFEMLGDQFDPGNPLSHHNLIEAYRSLAWERDDLVTDPDFAPMTGEALLDDSRLEQFADSIAATVSRFPAPQAQPAGTAYLCVADRNGLAVSLIQSNFHGIGSGIGAGNSGFLLHNRGAGACLIPGHPNELKPGKLPLHTLSPTIWGNSDRASSILGTRGGHQQPQLLAQLAAQLFSADAEPWVAQSRPRWSMNDFGAGEASKLLVEPDLGENVISDLRGRGHDITIVDGPTGGWGPVSVITISETGLKTAAADPRVDTASALAS